MAGHTPGPWAWFGNAGSNSLYLATTHSGRRYVMGFKRWGMRGAQPQFQPGGRGLVDASELLEFAVGDRSVRGVKEARGNGSVYRLDVTGIDCADAHLIAASPTMLAALQEARAALHQHYVDWDGEPEDASSLLAAIAQCDAAIAAATGDAK